MEVIKKNITEVSLCETGDIIKEEDGVYISGLGYFKKDDPRINIDCLSNARIIIDDKYNNTFRYNKIYYDINNEGEFINPKITISGIVSILNNTIQCNNLFIDSNLFNNRIFKTFYKEDLVSGQFVDVKTEIQEFKKNLKKHGAKYSKHPMSFLQQNKVSPFTYRRLYGKKYTFGIEIETISGALPGYVNNIGHFSSVFDGSLRHEDDNTAYGLEYVTSVLKGDSGLKELKFLCNNLSKRCLVNHKCANHFHIGDISFNKENIILMYYLYKKLEDEIFSMIPLPRRKNEYCKKLIDLHNFDLSYIHPENSKRNYFIDVYYDQIVRIMSNGQGVGSPSSNGIVCKKSDHPKGHKCGYDKSQARYSWVNFVPAIFNTRDDTNAYTIEFRMASGSLSYSKNKMWLLLCIGLVDVVENYKNYIYNNQNINLEDLINIVYPIGSSRICEFIKERKVRFSSNDSEENKLEELKDYLECEIDEDLSLKNL